MDDDFPPMLDVPGFGIQLPGRVSSAPRSAPMLARHRCAPCLLSSAAAACYMPVAAFCLPVATCCCPPPRPSLPAPLLLPPLLPPPFAGFPASAAAVFLSCTQPVSPSAFPPSLPPTPPLLCLSPHLPSHLPSLPVPHFFAVSPSAFPLSLPPHPLPLPHVPSPFIFLPRLSGLVSWGEGGSHCPLEASQNSSLSLSTFPLPPPPPPPAHPRCAPQHGQWYGQLRPRGRGERGPQSARSAAAGEHWIATGPQQDNSLRLADLRKMELLGRGASAAVYLVQHARTGQQYALKDMQLNMDADVQRHVGNELRINHQCRSPHVVRCYQVCWGVLCCAVLCDAVWPTSRFEPSQNPLHLSAPLLTTSIQAFVDDRHLFIVLECMDAVSLANVLQLVGGITKPTLPSPQPRSTTLNPSYPGIRGRRASLYSPRVHGRGAFVDDGHLFIVLEYMDAGSLADVLQAVGRITEPYLAAISRQALQGLRDLYQGHRIIHRDIKPSNMLLNQSGCLKISDFGVSRVLENSYDVGNTFAGTYTYMSPERIMGRTYSHNSDVWAFGLSLLECAIGQYPYRPASGGSFNYFDLLSEISNSPAPIAPPDYFSPQFCEFVALCLQKEPSQRPSAEQLLVSPPCHLPCYAMLWHGLCVLGGMRHGWLVIYHGACIYVLLSYTRSKGFVFCLQHLLVYCT
ncbi:unnamed protein product [Closterium sp. NIES-54]